MVWGIDCACAFRESGSPRRGQSCPRLSPKTTAGLTLSRTTAAACQPGCVEFVPANAAEAAALRDLHLFTWAVTYRERASEAWYPERLAAHAVRDWAEIVRSQAARGGGVLTARCDGRIVGLCQYGPTEDHDHDPEQVGQIHRLYVHPARQRTGIGRSLLTASVERLRQGGAHTAMLWVLETDQRAKAFYERLGWEPDGTRKTHPPTDVRYGLPLG
jgi:ribosomal protein S18 acetylase RimI-like enzyme